MLRKIAKIINIFEGIDEVYIFRVGATSISFLQFHGTVDILIMHSVGTVKTLCIMTYIQHEMCHNIVTSVTSAKMCDSKLSKYNICEYVYYEKLI